VAPRSRGLARLLAALRAARRRRLRRRDWERRWGRADFDEPWLDRTVAAEIEEAVASGWFAAGAPTLDIGCGQGDTAAWLAARGFPVLGVDVARSAIARARAQHAGAPGRLDFARVDVCAATPPGGPYVNLVDRGCLAVIARKDWPRYARNVIGASAPDARLLLYVKAYRDGVAPGDPAERMRLRGELARAFGDAFAIEREAPFHFDRHEGRRPECAMPGLVFWLRRRP
jgi:SAM-dependent methyltransferase